MNPIITAVIALIEEFLPLIPTGGSATAGAVIATIEKLIPLITSGAEALAGPIKNIITELASNDAVTPEQIAQLKALDAQIDASADTSMQGLDPDATSP